MQLVLASSSPRRRELLSQLGLEFVVAPANLAEPEAPPTELAPLAWVQALAFYKARAVCERYPDAWVLGADTLVVCGGELLGKPRDREEAQRMLDLQAERPSDVITGLALLHARHAPRRYIDADITRVWMRDDAALRAAYLDSGQWKGKAGAYGIQDVGDALIARYEGSFSNVVGLPLERLRIVLAAAGFSGVAR